MNYISKISIIGWNDSIGYCYETDYSVNFLGSQKPSKPTFEEWDWPLPETKHADGEDILIRWTLYEVTDDVTVENYDTYDLDNATEIDSVNYSENEQIEKRNA